MTDQTPQPISNELLRFLITEATQREVATVVAPLRSQLGVLDGKVTFLNRDFGTFSSKVDELDELVRGNPKQNLIGLAEQIKQQNTLISAISDQLAKAEKGREAMINQWRGAKYALSALAIVTGLANYDMFVKLFALFVP